MNILELKKYIKILTINVERTFPTISDLTPDECKQRIVLLDNINYLKFYSRYVLLKVPLRYETVIFQYISESNDILNSIDNKRNN